MGQDAINPKQMLAKEQANLVCCLSRSKHNPKEWCHGLSTELFSSLSNHGFPDKGIESTSIVVLVSREAARFKIVDSWIWSIAVQGSNETARLISTSNRGTES